MRFCRPLVLTACLVAQVNGRVGSRLWTRADADADSDAVTPPTCAVSIPLSPFLVIQAMKMLSAIPLADLPRHHHSSVLRPDQGPNLRLYQHAANSGNSTVRSECL